MGICKDSESESDKLAPVNEKILNEVIGDPFSDKFGSIRDSMSSLWRDSSSLWSSALEDPQNLLRQISGTNTDEHDRDYWDDLASDTVGSLLGVMGLPGGFSGPARMKGLTNGPFASEEIVRQGITGLYNYKTPTDSQFNECKDIGGLSVWGTSGWWRCLFPEKVVKDRLDDQKDLKGVVTKEKVEADTGHKLGLFFPDYTGFLTWKAHMNQLIREKREKAQQEQQKQQALNLKESDSHLAIPEDLMFDTSGVTDDGKQVISTYQNIISRSTPEGREQINERKTYYDNGTVLLKTEKKLVPADGSKPKVETSERVIPVSEDSN